MVSVPGELPVPEPTERLAPMLQLVRQAPSSLSVALSIWVVPAAPKSAMPISVVRTRAPSKMPRWPLP